MSRQRVVAALRERGPLSRSALSKALSVTRTTVGSHVDVLVDEGVLEELDLPPGGGLGRPPRPVWFTEDAGSVGAIVVARDRVSAAVVNVRGEIRAVDHAAVRGDAAQLGVDLLRSVRAPFGGLEGVGVVADGRDLAAVIARALGTDVIAAAPARAGAVAERWFGHGRACRDYWTVVLGDEVGAAVVVDGRLHLGRDERAGCVAHLPVGGDRPCSCGGRGCWTTVASRTGLAETAAALGHAPLGADELIARADAGDERARRVVAVYAGDVATGLVALDLVTAPGLVVVHGPPATSDGWSWSALRDAAGDTGARLVRSDLGEPGLLGAAALVLGDTWSGEGRARRGR
ncbi:MAG: ROK family protein [Actinomycetota bacterium]|nr:ROK family protein [Actinomycetota bacterium]